MKYLGFKLLDFVIRNKSINFSLKKELKPKFLLSCFMKLALDVFIQVLSGT